MEKRYILFDLDGTLTDSYEGIINGFKYCLSKFNVEPKPDTFRKCIGPPVVWSLKTFYGFDDATAEKGLKYFREYYEAKGYLENRVYPGVEEMLKILRAHDKKLILSTSKPETTAHRVLERFGLNDYFCFIAGSDNGSTGHKPRITKDEVVEYVLRENGIFDRENAVMVGDRVYDIAAGKLYGLQTIGVGYGYAAEGELESSGADYIADSPEMVSEIIIQR